MREELSLREIQLAEYRLMRETVEMFEQENLEYFLCGGTMLGAVRHKGFIPWDDDVDLYMPRKDYDRLRQMARENKVNIKDAHIVVPGDKESPFPYIKVLDSRIRIDDHVTSEKFNNSVWVDIFPLDHYPNSLFLHKCWVSMNFLLRGALVMETTRTGMNRSRPVRAAGWVLNRLLGGYRNINRLIDFNARLMNSIHRNSSHYANGVLPEGMEDYFGIDAIQPMTKMLFEDREYNVPEHYELYLTHFYGDYMTPPPENERARHHVTAWHAEE